MTLDDFHHQVRGKKSILQCFWYSRNEASANHEHSDMHTHGLLITLKKGSDLLTANSDL